MSEIEAAAALRDALWLLIKAGGPLLILALVVGLLVSLLQAVTQINEPTLVFLPKVMVIGAALVVLGPFIMDQLSEFTLGLLDRMVSIGGR
jgi:flagellar biosynthetic protein FliQ